MKAAVLLDSFTNRNPKEKKEINRRFSVGLRAWNATPSKAYSKGDLDLIKGWDGLIRKRGYHDGSLKNDRLGCSPNSP